MAIALLAACGDDDSGGGDIPISGLEGAVINAYCNIYVSCGLLDDAATCKQIYTDIEIDPSLVAAVEAGKVIYHPDKARECINGLSSTCDRNTFNRNDNAEACDQTFEGTVGANGQCAMNEECISQQCDVPSCPDACCQGTCFGDMPPTRPHIGESCGTTGSCVASYCNTTTLICEPYLADGAACTSASQCLNGSCTNQMCVGYPGTGEPCGGTASTLCANLGDVCNTTSMTCVAYALGGDSCTADRDCSPIYSCGTAGTCQLKPRFGEACVPQTSNDCIDRSYCDPTTNLCTAPKADGGSCTTDRECASNNCDNTTTTCSTLPICI
ncbi:MAG TPA: hypothetical protein VFV99_28765 [Kofleriaceae bacterium]|nr:hypothetical protein [Kofleriaceae bacterium]